MNPKLRALLALKQEKLTAARALSDAAGDAGMVAEVAAQFDALMGEASTVQASIDREKALIEAERAAPALPAAVIPALSGARVTENIENDPRRGFAHMGQFAGAVFGAVMRPNAADPRLLTLNAAAASTYANESVGADGGFLVPPEYASGILSVLESPEQLMSRVRQVPISGNSMTFPKNESTAHGTDGVQAYWDYEGDAITQSKPAFKSSSIRLDRLTALVPMTEELLEDSAAAGAWVQMEAQEKMAFKVSDAILNATGAGTLLGVMKSPCLVTVSKEGSQAADTLLGANVLKMYSRMPAASRARAVWVINQDLEPQLPSLNIPIKNVAGTENVGGMPVFIPPGGLSGSMYGTLLGRPVITTEAAAAVGDLGDIVFADFQNFIALTKGGIKTDQSMHLWFDQNLRAFRFILRMGGQPWLSAPISRKNGSNTLSHFVTLEAR